MKKLMLGMAIAAVGSAFAVESSNIVGYNTQQTDTEGGFTAITPMFTSLENEGAIKLSNMSFEPSRYDNIQIFDGNGDVVKYLTYQKHKAAQGGDFYWELTDYTNDPDDPEISEVTDFSFTRGQSVWLSFADSIDFTQSGAVNAKPMVYEIPGEGAFIQAGNPRPTALKLSELVFSDLARYDNIQIFDRNGDVVKYLTYQKHKAAQGGDFYWELTDYTNDPDDPEISEINPAEYEFPAGQAFWFSLANEGTVTIPALNL